MDETQSYYTELALTAARLYSPRHDFGSYELLDSFLLILPYEGTLLDIGCSIGMDTRNAHNVGLKITGFDKNAHSVWVAKKRCPNALLFCADMANDASYIKVPKQDGVLCTSSLQHISFEAWPGIIQNAASTLKPGGHALFVTTCDQRRDTVENVVWSRSVSREYTLQNYYAHPDTLIKNIERAGLKCIEVTYDAFGHDAKYGYPVNNRADVGVIAYKPQTITPK